MRVGLAGYGAWGRFHARSLREIERVTLAALFCRGEESAAAAAHDHPGVPIVRHLDDLFHYDLDAVDIVLPNHLHAQACIAALEAGCHTLVEKPLAITRADCDRVIEAARRTGRQVSVTHEMRASPHWGRIKQEIAAGTIGRPVCGSFTLFRHPYRQGSSGWRYDQGRVGSWLLEEPVHFFDLLVWYFAELGDPQTIIADCAGATAQMSDNIMAIVRYGNGACFQVTQMLGGFGHHCHLELAGSKGALRTWWSADTARSAAPRFALEVRRSGTPKPETVEVPESGEVFELTACLRSALRGFEQNQSFIPPAEARKAVLLCLAAETSCSRGDPVSLQ